MMSNSNQYKLNEKMQINYGVENPDPFQRCYISSTKVNSTWVSSIEENNLVMDYFERYYYGV